MGLPHLVAALSGSRAYRGELVSHGRNYRNSATPRPVDRNRIAGVLDYCRIADDGKSRGDWCRAELLDICGI